MVSAAGLVSAMLLVTPMLAGCSDDAEKQRLTEERVERERRDAAQSARQGERLKDVERELRESRQRGQAQQQASPPPRSPSGNGSTRPSTPSTRTSDSWPEGRTAWTVVLASASSRGEAESVADRANSAGLPQAGVLFSSNYASLNRGYWVAYTGVLGKAEAQARQSAARGSGFGSAYARYISAR